MTGATQSSAIFSVCRQYRYTLTRRWSDGLACMFLMLNPSTADEVNNDPTVERCERRARSMPGIGALVVCNIFAFRSTDPRVLYDELDPIGPRNDAFIVTQAEEAKIVICAWGTHGKLNGRGAAVLKLLADAGIQPHALRVNGDGTPAHPLYLPYTLEASPMAVAGQGVAA